MQQKYGERLKVVLVAGEPAELVKRDPGLAGAPVTFLADAAHVYDQYGVSGIPHTFYFDRGGSVALEMEGYSDGSIQELEKRVAADLGDRSASAR